MTKPVVDVKALAALARLEVSDAELLRLENELPAILSFVEQVQKVSVDVSIPTPEVRNVMREDINPIEPGIYTQVLLSAAPATEANRVVVKQVLSKNK